MLLPALDAFFCPAPGGHRLYLHHAPPGGRAPRGALLYVHPWAEEMNKSRRMAALAARALADDGWAVLQLDLFGCGDSSGDFGGASWQLWVDDVTDAARWLQARHPGLPLWFWGLRAGALLCAAAARALPDGPAGLLCWQPLLQGKSQLQQFLRLKAAAAWADGKGGAATQAARDALAAGHTVDVAGYRTQPALAQGLEAAVLEPTGLRPGRLIWLEVQNQPEPALAPAAQKALPRWSAAGWQVHSAAVQGPPFWQTTEIEDAPALLAATQQALATVP